MNNKNVKWILLIIAGILIFTNMGGLPKETVAQVEGKACVEDIDCPCFGTYNVTGTDLPEAYGLGISECIDCTKEDNINRTSCVIGGGLPNVCDTTYCVDVQDVTEWARDNPWEYLRTNPFMLLAILGLIIVGIIYPHR